MSLTYAILSALISDPSSGYDLAKRFNASIEGSVGFSGTPVSNRFTEN